MRYSKFQKVVILSGKFSCAVGVVMKTSQGDETSSDFYFVLVDVGNDETLEIGYDENELLESI